MDESTWNGGSEQRKMAKEVVALLVMKRKEMEGPITETLVFQLAGEVLPGMIGKVRVLCKRADELDEESADAARIASCEEMLKEKRLREHPEEVPDDDAVSGDGAWVRRSSRRRISKVKDSKFEYYT